MLLEPFIVNDRTPFQRWCDGSGPRTTPDYVYVASSRWNHLQQAVVGALRFLKIPHYDFRNPEAGNHGFWQNIDPEWKQWTPQQWREGLRNPISQKAFHLDLTALRKADVGVLVLPCGISASLEAGYLALSSLWPLFLRNPS
jgi:hypothetical protein